MAPQTPSVRGAPAKPWYPSILRLVKSRPTEPAVAECCGGGRGVHISFRTLNGGGGVRPVHPGDGGTPTPVRRRMRWPPMFVSVADEAPSPPPAPAGGPAP